MLVTNLIIQDFHDDLMMKGVYVPNTRKEVEFMEDLNVNVNRLKGTHKPVVHQETSAAASSDKHTTTEQQGRARVQPDGDFIQIDDSDSGNAICYFCKILFYVLL